ncbi:MAG: hypothetical protein ACYTF6_05130 [Planctomycetota bacterium]
MTVCPRVVWQASRLLVFCGLAIAGAGCRTPEKAFEQIELGKPLDAKVMPLFAKETKNGVSYESRLGWILPPVVDWDVLHVVKDDEGLVVAKSYYCTEGVDWGITKSLVHRYVLETVIPEEYYAEAPEDWDGAKLFEKAFPYNIASARKSLHFKLVALVATGSASKARALSEGFAQDELKMPAELPGSFAEAERDLWRQMQTAAAEDEKGKTSQPARNIPTRLMMSVLMLETLGANRPQREAQDISVALYTRPVGLIDQIIVLPSWPATEEPWEVVEPNLCEDEGSSARRSAVRFKHLGKRRIRVEYEDRFTWSLFARAALADTPQPSRPTTQPAEPEPATKTDNGGGGAAKPEGT